MVIKGWTEKQNIDFINVQNEQLPELLPSENAWFWSGSTEPAFRSSNV